MHLAPGASITDETDEIPASTRWHRAHGRQIRRERAVKQQLLTPQEEKALVDHVLRLYRNGHAARVKYLRYFAGVLLRRRTGSSETAEQRLPGKDWPKAFCLRHPELEAARRKAIDSERHEKNIRAKVQSWFEIMGKQLSEPGILQENVYNMDETGVLLGDLDTVKVLIARGDKEQRRGRALKRTMITAVECVSADGRSLPPFIIFPGKTLRSTWVTSHETPGWHYGCSEKGYNVSALNMYWVQHVFEPATRDRASGRPRVLIIDGFGSHESLYVLTFGFKNNIIICRQPSHATHKLQPLDIAVFSPLKTAFREQVDQLYRNGAETVNKAHFTLLYSRARQIAITSRNIRSGWSKAGLYPFNPAKVLDSMQVTPAETNDEIAAALVRAPLQPLLSPTSLRTPTNAMSLMALQQRLEERPKAAAGIDPYFQKVLKAAERAFADVGLLKDENQGLRAQSNEKKTREHVKERKIGEAKVMGYEAIVEAMQVRDRKEAEAERKKAERERKKAERQRRKVERENNKAERKRGKASKEPRDKVRKSRVTKRTVASASQSEPQRAVETSSVLPTEPAYQAANVALSNQSTNMTDIVWAVERSDEGIPWQAPVARMY